MKREDLLLTLLYSPGSSKNVNESIEGNIKLMKMIFLIQNELKTQLYNFVPYDLGPASFEVYDDIDNLKKENIILEEIARRNIKSFKLTQKGLQIAEKAFKELQTDVRNAIVKIKKEFNGFPTSKIILYVYKFYPNYSRNSILKPF